MTVGTGAFAVTKDASSPAYAVASGGSTGVTLGVLKLHASNEDMYLRQMRLQLTNTASSSASNFVGGAVSLYDGTTLVGTAIFNGANTVATSTFLGNGVLLPKDTDKMLTVKADLSSIGTSKAGTEGALIAVDYDGDYAAGTYAVGASSGSNLTSGSSSDTAMDGVRVFRSFPTLAKASVPTNVLSNGTQALMRFTVTADAAGDIGIDKFTVKFSTTTVNVTGVNVFGYTDSSYSTPVSGVTSGGQLMASNASPNASGIAEVYSQNSGGTASPLQIPAGQTRYFEVRGTVAGLSSSGTVITDLEGDSAYPSLSGLMGVTTFGTGVDADANNDFIWSPNATGTSGVATNDWTNGFGLVGLPATNMAPEVLSK
jgi:hypothetical protein